MHVFMMRILLCTFFVKAATSRPLPVAYACLYCGLTRVDPLVQAMSASHDDLPDISRNVRDAAIPIIEAFLLSPKISALLSCSPNAWHLYRPDGHLHAARHASLRKLTVYSSQVHRRDPERPIVVTGPLNEEVFFDQLNVIDPDFAPFIRYIVETVMPVLEEQALFASP